MRAEYFPDYDKNATWNLLYAYIDAHSQILIDEYPGDGVQAITIFQYQCENITFADQIIYNRLFRKLMHIGGDSAINYIKIFQNTKALVILLGNIYSNYPLIHAFLEIFQHAGK